MLRIRKQSGFTIIELIMVIVVIGILAILVFVGYNGVQRRSNIALLQNDLKSAQSQLGLDFVNGGESYPDTIEDANGGKGLKFTDKAQVLYAPRNDEEPKGYCITAIIGDLVYHVERGSTVLEGYCNEHQPDNTPEQPTIITNADSQTQITVSWEAVDDVTAYRLQYSQVADFSSGVTTINGISSSATSQAVTGLSPATTYNFRLYAVNGSYESEPSDTVEETTVAAPIPGLPTVTCTANSPTQITVNWTSVAGATSYTLMRSTSNTFPTGSTTVTTSGLTGSTTAVTGLAAGTRYYFKMNAVSSGGPSAYTSPINCITTINAPDSPTVTVAIPGSARSASSGPWAKDYNGNPTSGNWYYASGAVSSSTCASGTTRQQRARVQYNSPTTWGAWTSYTTSSTFYAIGPNTGYGIRFQVQTRCYTSVYTSAASSSSYGCRWRSGSTSCSGF